MSDQSPYSINLDESFGSLEFIDVGALADAVEEQWFNQTLVRVNDCVVRLGVMQGSSTGTTTTRRTSSSTWWKADSL